MVALVDGDFHDFGTMPLEQTGSYIFKIRNDGPAPLELTRGESTCKCTEFTISHEELLFGEIGEVLLKWKPDELKVDFEQSANVITNDPVHPMVKLTIHGQVLLAARPVPPRLSLGRILGSKAHTSRIVVYGYRDEPVRINDFKTSTPENRERFEIRAEPLTPELLLNEPSATSGQSVMLTVKAGLPLGPLQETVRLQTNQSELPVIEVPVYGMVVGDISIVGRNFRDEKNILVLGAVTFDKGARQMLHILVKGPYRRDVTLSLESIDPSDVLRATIGEPNDINGGVVIKYPLLVEVVPDSRPVTRRGTEQSQLGVIKIKTTHPHSKEVPVFVDFAVQK